MASPRIAIAGAGSVGAYIGTLLAHSGQDVRFLGRMSLTEVVERYGLTATDHDGRLAHLSPAAVTVAESPSILADADLILVTVKSRDTAEMADLIARHARADAVVVSFQNGIENASRLRAAMPGRRVLAGMVPFNVVSLGRGQYRRATSGTLILEAAGADLVPVLETPGHAIQLTDDMPGVLWGKLLMNLNNALNALSGLPLIEQLADGRWRHILAQMQSEALAAMKAAGVAPRAASPMPPRMMPLVLRLPTPLFRLVAARSLKIDPAARSSMWEDLQRGRPTEIDDLQGQVIRLAEAAGTSAPICARVTAAIKRAEQAEVYAPMTARALLRAE